jgi:GNAT superfamily N-acetyltransferase
VATAALKIREMETHPQYEHWLGNVYVLPEFRAQGIGTTVIERAKHEAKRIGIRDLYLYTRDRAHCTQD